MGSMFIEVFGNYPLIRVIDFFLEEYLFDYSKTQVAELSEVSFNTLELFWNKLIKLEMIVKTRKVGNSQMYKLNLENPLIQKLMEIDRGLMMKSSQKVKVPIKIRR